MFDISKLCSRATRSLLLLSVLLGLSSCGGCFGGQGDGSGGFLRDAVLGEDEPEKRYKAPVFRVAYSGTLGQNGEVDLFAAVIRREGPLVRWEVNIEATCGEARCEEHDAFYEGEFPQENQGSLEIRHRVASHVTKATANLDIYFVADNSPEPVKATGMHGMRFETPEARFQETIIQTPEELENLQLLEDGVFEGDLSIKGVSGLEDLSALSELREVRGSLNIYGNPDLVSLKGLERLERVTENVWLSNNWNLREQIAFPSLREAGGVTFLGINAYGEEDLRPMPALQKADSIQFLQIMGTKRYEGFDSLESLGELNIVRTATLEHVSLGEHHNFTRIERVLFERNHNLDTLSLPPDLRSVDSIIAKDNHSPPPLEGFAGVEWVQMLDLYNNHGLENLKGFSRVKQLDYLDIFGNDDLTSLEGLDNLELVTSHFEIGANEKLSHCEVVELELRTRGDEATDWAKGSNCPANNR